MRKRTMAAMLGVLFVAAAVAGATLDVYFLNDGGGGDLLWNADEGYLFIGSVQRGYHVRYLKYPWVILMAHFHDVQLPDDQRVSVKVIRVTSSGIERHMLDFGQDTANTPEFYTPLKHNIYAQCPGMVLCRWTGAHFERAMADEERTLGNISHLTNVDFSNVDGWSKHGVGPAPVDYEFTAEIGKQLVLLIKNRQVEQSGNGSVSIDVLHPGQPPERVWALDESARRVSKAEYERIFARR